MVLFFMKENQNTCLSSLAERQRDRSNMVSNQNNKATQRDTILYSG